MAQLTTILLMLFNLLFISALVVGYFQIIRNVDECRQSLRLIAYYEEKRFKADESKRNPSEPPPV